MPAFVPWLLSALLALAAGVLWMEYLVAQPLTMSWFFASLVVVILLWLGWSWRNFQHWQLLWNLGLFVASFIAGYLVSAWVYLSQSEKRELPPITRPAGDPGDGHTAVLYFTHGEPPAYSPLPWIETFHELDKDGVSFVPWPFRPLFLNNVRREYLEIGGSAHNKIHQIMLRSLMLSMPQALRQGTRFYLAFLDSPPRPDEMALRAVEDGASKLVVMPVFLTESSHTIAGRKMVDAVKAEQFGLEVCYAKPLWDTASLQQMFVERANEHLEGIDKSQVGILLVGHGQPDDWDAIYPTQTEQENAFRLQVRDRLIQDGYKAEKVVLGWMEFKKPDIREAVRQLVAQDVRLILIFSAAISADSIHSDIQVPEAVEKANVPAGVKVVNLGAWGNSPQVIAAIRQRILECAPHLAEAEAARASQP